MGKVTTIVWNERYQKLTTSDDKGLIIVWCNINVFIFTILYRMNGKQKWLMIDKNLL